MKNPLSATPALIGLAAGLVLALIVLLIPPAADARPDAPPGIAETCVACHEEVVLAFASTVHGRERSGWKPANVCEACHGPSQTHVEEPQKTNILHPGRMSGSEANEMCLSCHVGMKETRHWATTRHAAMEVKCADCHDVHTPWTNSHALQTSDINQTCFTCHPQMRKSMFQRSSHLLRGRQILCSSCHDPHGSAGEKALHKATVNETCYTCHLEKRGPFLFEHAPVREDCLGCHVPHGSNNTMLLKAPTIRLCQSCHLLGHHQTVASQPGQIWVQNRACVNCHSQIHGSNHPSGAIFQR